MNKRLRTRVNGPGFLILGIALIGSAFSHAETIAGILPVSEQFEFRNSNGALIAFFDGFGNLAFDGLIDDTPTTVSDTGAEEILIMNNAGTVVARLDPAAGANGTLFLAGDLFWRCGLDSLDPADGTTASCDGYPAAARNPATFETFRTTNSGPSLVITNLAGETTAWLDDDGNLYLWGDQRDPDTDYLPLPSGGCREFLQTSTDPTETATLTFADSLLDVPEDPEVCADDDAISVWDSDGTELLFEEVLGSFTGLGQGCTLDVDDTDFVVAATDNWIVIRATSVGSAGACSVRVWIDSPTGCFIRDISLELGEEMVIPIR